MKTSIGPGNLSPYSLVLHSIQFFGSHFLFVFGLGLAAALGRAIQLGAIGELRGGVNFLLEIIIESARVLTFLLVIGEGSIDKGLQRIKGIFYLNRDQWKSIRETVITKLKVNWIALLANLVIYSVIAFVVNFIIDKLTYDTNLLNGLKNSHILAPQTTEWVLLLFFKNMTVIPFTIIFNGILMLWITNVKRYRIPA